MNKYQYSSLIGRGAIVIVIFYTLLVILSKALIQVPLPGINSINLLFIPLLMVYIGIGVASRGFQYIEETDWFFGKRIFILSIVSSILIVIGLIIFTIQHKRVYLVLELLGLGLLTLGHIGLAILFYFLKEDLYDAYLDEKIIKKPDNMLIISYSLQSISFSALFISYLNDGFYRIDVYDIISILCAGIAVIPVIIGGIKLNIQFKAYPYMFEEEMIERRKK